MMGVVYLERCDKNSVVLCVRVESIILFNFALLTFGMCRTYYMHVRFYMCNFLGLTARTHLRRCIDVSICDISQQK